MDQSIQVLAALKDYQILLAALVAMCGGLWALNAHLRRRDHDPRIQFRVYVRFVGHHDKHWIAELLAVAENRGQVPHRMSGLTVNLLGFAAGDDMKCDPSRFGGQLEFGHKLAPPNGGELSLMPEGPDRRVVLYPATSMRYMHVTCVPDTMRFLLIHGTLSRPGAEPLRADRVVRVPAVELSASGQR